MTFLDRLETSYLSLPHMFYTKLEPQRYNDSSLELLNEGVANIMGLPVAELKTTQGVEWLSGSITYNGAPFAQAYAGHQYGYFTKLGDGRAAIIGEIVHNGSRYDIHLKGSGRTPYSRRGDGKATLYSMLREYLISEAMHHLGVPTTRSLSVVLTGNTVQRESLHQGAILSRVGASHIRFGTFEYARAHGTTADVKELADYTINRHYPHLSSEENKYIQFYKEVVQKQAKLVALWQSIGFVHGVLNTDNMLISGETIDYGPCAFLDQYTPSVSFSSIDRNGRYSYRNQPYIISWNLSKLAEALLPLIDSNQQQAIALLNIELQQFETIFTESYYNNMRRKLGLLTDQLTDVTLVDNLLHILETEEADYTNCFYHLTKGTEQSLSYFSSSAFQEWYERWNKRINNTQTIDQARRLMREHNPVLIPRNQLVEKAITEYAFENNKSLFLQLVKAYQDPYNYHKVYDLSWLEPLHPTQNFTTYCGT